MPCGQALVILSEAKEPKLRLIPREFYVYLFASDSRKLYVGVTGNLARRVSQHRTGFKPTSYTAKHETNRLVYCETTNDVQAAIRREKQIKGWTRRRKLELIETLNPDWNDLAGLVI